MTNEELLVKLISYKTVDGNKKEEFINCFRFIKEYLGDKYSYELEKHFVSYISIIAYYWFVWALFRESCSAIMGESLYNWYYMAKKYSKYFLNIMLKMPRFRCENNGFF